MGAWIVLFFVTVLTLLANTTQTVTDARRADTEVEGAVDTLVNIMHAQHRYYLYNDPENDPGFIQSNLSGALDWLDDRDCGGASCYRVVDDDPNVKVLYQARSAAIAARIALHFGDLACTGDADGDCLGTPGNSGGSDRVILHLAPTSALPLLANHFMTRDGSAVFDAGTFEMSSIPGGSITPTLQIQDTGSVFITRGISIGLSLSLGAGLQDHTDPLWRGTQRPSGDGVLIEVTESGGALAYTRDQSSGPLFALQARGSEALFSAGPLQTADNHLVDSANSLSVDEVEGTGADSVAYFGGDLKVVDPANP